MYKARLFATRHSRAYERFYSFAEPIILSIMGALSRLSGGKLDQPMTWLERQTKETLFDCKMCGNCVLSSTGMTCPMNCPKTIRNGPCGGVRDNGHCEVKPEMRCVWVEAWDGASRMRGGNKIHEVQFATNKAHLGTSAWLRMLKEREQASAEAQAKLNAPSQSSN
ncbi:MAG: methylenetetrahydrofolate reductase C-terminal domain-containing protein [Pseudomonadota bacterium]